MRVNFSARFIGKSKHTPLVRLFLAVLIAVCSASAGPSKVLAHLPNTGINAIKVDASGNIYVAGFQGMVGALDSYDAFIVKLSPDGSKILYSTRLGGSKSDSAVALDIDSTGAAYIFGQTQSPDFPVTPGVLQTTMLAGEQQGFVAKIDVQGKLIYATLIGGGSAIYPSAGGLLVDGAGEVFVSGQTSGDTFPTSPGAPFTSADADTSFVLKLDADGRKQLAAIRGIGGLLATDDQSNVYIAGFTSSTQTAIPLTAGAFQSASQLNGCFGIPCSYQYVTKLNATLTRIVYSTYVTGSRDAAPAAISVDAQGNVLLAGNTHSPDYPTTSDAFEPTFIANAPPPPQTCLFGCIPPPPPGPSSGYITKLNSQGTGLIYSSFFSGTQQDLINFAAFTSEAIYLAGQAGSPDLPGLDGTPSQCLPQNFETRLTPDGLAVAAGRFVPGNVLAYDPTTGTLLAWTGVDLIRFDPSAAPNPIVCVLDAADLQPVPAIAPGELLSIFGLHFVSGIPEQTPGSFATSLAGVTVSLNGIASPLLYVSPQQINVQIPYEIAGQTQAIMTLTSSQTKISDSRTLSVIAMNPVAFLDTVTSPASVDLNHCHLAGSVLEGGLLPLAFNSDGSRNTCLNPASGGSIIRIFLAGLGVTVPAPVTGSINPNPGTPLNLPITFSSEVPPRLASAIALPGSITGVWQVDILMPAESGAIPVSLSVNSVPVRDGNLTIWMH